MIITQTPLRVSLLGGNTDFAAYFKKHGGAVLTMAIDKYIYCIVKERYDDLIYINYSEKEKVSNVNEIKHDLVREALRLVVVEKGIEITFLSDVPSEGSGLASSSAVVVGLLNALHQYKHESVTARQLAEEACRIEIDILKKPIGYQDQYAVAFGGVNLIEFGKEIKVQPIEAKLDYLALFYTGSTRKADSILSQMKLDTEILDKTKALVYRCLDILPFDNLLGLGSLLEEYWFLKRNLNQAVTNIEIEGMYSLARSLGAYGGKIVGAGGGGFMLLVIPPEKRKVFINKFNYKELPFNLSKDGSKVIFNIQ